MESNLGWEHFLPPWEANKSLGAASYAFPRLQTSPLSIVGGQRVAMLAFSVVGNENHSHSPTLIAFFFLSAWNLMRERSREFRPKRE